MDRENLNRGFLSVKGSSGFFVRNIERGRGGGGIPMETVRIHLNEVTIPFSFVSKA